jgi:hypothetical protein
MDITLCRCGCLVCYKIYCFLTLKVVPWTRQFYLPVLETLCQMVFELMSVNWITCSKEMKCFQQPTYVWRLCHTICQSRQIYNNMVNFFWSCLWNFQHFTQWLVLTIDIENLQNRLLKVCYVPTTCVVLNRLLFLLRP